MSKIMDELNYELTWIAVQGLSPDQALATLKREISGAADVRDMPGWPDITNRRTYWNRIFMGVLPGNWLLLFGDLDEKDKKRLSTLTKFGPAFAGEISRMGCWSEGQFYQDGRQTWSVDYDMESYGRDDFMKVEGRLPEYLAAIYGEAQKAVAMQLGRDAGVDLLFEVPGKMSKAICGFSPHEEPPEGFRWSMLQRIGGEPEPKGEPKPKGCLALLFGWR